MSYLTIPTTFEDKFLDEVKETQKRFSNSKFKITEVYGSLPMGVIGSGRNPWDIPKVSVSQLRNHIKKAHRLGFKFGYLLNASCLSNIEYSYSGRKKMIEFLDLLVDLEVDVITVTIPLLAELIKERCPQFKVNTSMYSEIDTLDKALFYQDIGADRITLHPDIHRNFPLLRKIRKHVKVDLQLLVNTSCLFSCPTKHFHANATGHFSQIKDEGKESDFFPAFSFNERCMLYRLQNPVEFIKTPWIRPEDLPIYTDLGINYFKIAGREYSGKHILTIAEAYLSSHYDGNLATLLMGFFNIYLFKEPLKFYIDNNKLSGLINFFVNSDKFPCKDGCSECGYCKNYAELAVKIDKESRDEYIKLFSEKLKQGLYIEEKIRLSSYLNTSYAHRSNIFLKILDKLYQKIRL